MAITNSDLIISLYRRYRIFILYCIIGCSGASLDFIIYLALVTFTDISYRIANIIGCTCGIINNFFLNYIFNFKTKDHLLMRLLCFYCVGLLGLGLSSLVLYLLVDCLETNKILAKILTIFVIVIVQYSLNKHISFKKQAGKHQTNSF